VVSTTSAPLLPRVEAGEFNATLFYRLNTVCVDVTTLSPQSLQES
jgi:DNA-binding NtrC family response regulator